MTDFLINFTTSGEQVVIGALRNIGGGLVSLAGNALGNAASGFADFARNSFAGAIEAQAGIDQLTASIANLGKASPLTIDSAMAMADEFKNLVGGSDEVVLAMANVGLRFDQISAETMPGFIEASADLAAALGQDPVAASQTLGRVLQDLSVDGEGSLGRLTAAGVTLTDQQKEQILAMVSAGDAAGAQQLVLNSLADTIGGKAAAASDTFAGQMAIMRETVADAGEGVMLALMPALTQLASEVLPQLTPLIASIAAAATTFITNQFLPAFLQAVDWIKANWPAIQQQIMDGWAAAQPVLQQVSDFVLTVVMPAFGELVGWIVANWPTIKTTISAVLDSVNTVITNVLGGIQRFWDTWGDEILSIVRFMTAQISIVVDIFTAAFRGDWREFGERIRDYFDNAWDAIMKIVRDAINWFAAQDWGEIGYNILRGIAAGITSAVGLVRDAAVSAASAAFEAAKGFLGIQSPSRLFEVIGENMMMGMANGITNTAYAPATASAAAAQAVTYATHLGGVNVYAAQGQSASDIADAVMTEIARRARGYALAGV